MSILKIAIYGGIGYLVYQAFFADTPSNGGRERRRTGGSAARGQEGRSEQSEFSQRPRAGAVERTLDPTGMSATHRVGRGVVS